MKNIKWIFILLITPVLVAIGQEKTFIKEYSYNAGEMDSKISCRAIAVNELRANLLQEIGVYVESEQLLKTTEVGGSFSQDFIENVATITAGITKLEILDEKWNGETFWMKASITVDKKNLEESLKQLISDRQKVKELEEIKKQLIETTTNLNALKIELSKIKKENEKIGLAEKYNSNIDNLNLTDFEYSLISLFYKGFAKFKLGDFKGALSAFNDALSLNPEFAKLNFNSTSRKLDGVYGEIYNARGSAKAQLNDNMGAIMDYNKAIEINKEFSMAYYNRGLSKVALGDSEGGIQDYNRAIQIDSGDVNAYVDRAIAKSYLGDYVGAISDCDVAIKLNSNDSRAFMQRGNAKGELDDYKGAIKDYNMSIKLNPDNGFAYANRGLANNYLNNRKDACLDWKKAVELGFSNAYELIQKHCK